MAGIPADPDPYRDPWHIDAGAIRRTRLIGEGFFGKVYDGILHGTREVALKYLTNQHAYLEDLIKEAELIRNCDHPNILKTIGICTSLRVIVTEKMANGNLKLFLVSHILSPEECLSVALKIASGMIYLGQMGIVHRDLAARNVLVGASIDTIKIADFGLSRSLEDQGCYTTLKDVFPLEWTAPEGFSVPCTITSASDMWSYGVLLWELYSNGDDPYSEIVVTRHDLYRRLTEDNYRLQCPPKCPTLIFDWMLAFWRIEPTNRPKFDEFLRALTWNDYQAQLIKPSDPSAMNRDQDAVRPTNFFFTWYSRPATAPAQPHSSTNNSRSVQPVVSPRQPAVEHTKTLSSHSAGQRSIKSVHGSYLRANEPAWTADFMARQPREWEHWYIEDKKEGEDSAAGKVALKGRGGETKPGQFLRAYWNGHIDLTGKHPKDEPLAIWMSYKNSNGSWSFQSADGLWLSAHRDGSARADANWGTNAQFTLENW